MCNEPHSIDTIIDLWIEVSPTIQNTLRGLPYYAALHVGNIPLFRTLANRLGTSTEDRRCMLHGIACCGSIDLFREYHQYIKNIDKANSTVNGYQNEENIILHCIGTSTLGNPNALTILKYLRDHTPPSVNLWNEQTIEEGVLLGRLDVVQFLRNEIDISR